MVGIPVVHGREDVKSPEQTPNERRVRRESRTAAGTLRFHQDALRAESRTIDAAPSSRHLPAQPSVRVRGTLHHIVTTLGRAPNFYTATPTPQAAESHAAEHAERGRTPVVDEAHLLDNAQMEAIRMLTNHDMNSGSPFTGLLVGQPTLRHRLKFGVLAALDHRIAVRYALAGIAPPDTADYTGHHLEIADRSDPLFSDDAITLIHTAARGTRGR